MTRGTCQGEENEHGTQASSTPNRRGAAGFEGYTASIFVRVGMDLNTLVRVKLRADGSRPFGIGPKAMRVTARNT